METVFKLAKNEDLFDIIEMFKKLVRKMNENGIEIWDDIYPAMCFGEDIQNNRQYLLTEGDKILSSITFLKELEKAEAVEWSDKNAKAVYLTRLGVLADCPRSGIGQKTLEEAKTVARKMGAEYLRLFVVDINTPAISLYEKSGFKKMDGIYDLVFDDGEVLHEYAFEYKL